MNRTNSSSSVGLVNIYKHLDRVQNDENFQWRNQSLLLPESQLMETREESAPTYAQLNRQMHGV